MIERMFMAADTDNEFGAQYGPFASAKEAEKDMRRLGWTWILVYTHTVDEYGTILDVKTRFFQPDVRDPRSPGDIEALRRMVVVDVPPLTNAEERFLKQYEEQMEGFKL